MARDHRKLRVFRDARASGAEVAYLVHLTFELEMMTKSSFAVLDQSCEQLVPQLEALVESVSQLWVDERKTRRATAARKRSRVRTESPKPKA